MTSGRRPARELLVLTAVAYEALAALVALFPYGVVLFAPLSWLPAALPLGFRRSRRAFRIAALLAGGLLLTLAAGFLIVGGLILVPGALLLLAGALVRPDVRWPSRPYWLIASAPIAVVVAFAGVATLVDRFGPPTAFEVHVIPGATEAQVDGMVGTLLDDPAVRGVGSQGPFDWRNPLQVEPKPSPESAEGRRLRSRLEAHPVVDSVRPCRC